MGGYTTQEQKEDTGTRAAINTDTQGMCTDTANNSTIPTNGCQATAAT